MSKLNALSAALLRSPLLWGGALAFAFFTLIHGAAFIDPSDTPNPAGGGNIRLRRGQFFGEMGLFGIDRRTAFVRARGRAEIAEIPYSRFRQLANETPSLTFEIATQLAVRLERTNRKLSDLAFVDVSGRIAHALLDLCDEPEAMTHPEGTQIRVSRQELSRLVGCSREMAGRVLKALEAQGLLQARGKTVVLFDVRPASRGLVAARTLKTLPGKAGRAQPAAAIAACMARTVAA